MFDPRQMMEKAIEVMRQSVPEHRSDGSPSPMVGAVLVRPDGSIETAARGELREGNHAEFILLERKCPGERLDGCLLFTTLEPCLNRNHPKRGCARHLVGARIGKCLSASKTKSCGGGQRYRVFAAAWRHHPHVRPRPPGNNPEGKPGVFRMGSEANG